MFLYLAIFRCNIFYLACSANLPEGLCVLLALICSFCKKIYSVNSQLSKEINFEILFHILKHVLFCGRNFTYGAL